MSPEITEKEFSGDEYGMACPENEISSAGRYSQPAFLSCQEPPLKVR